MKKILKSILVFAVLSSIIVTLNGCKGKSVNDADNKENTEAKKQAEFSMGEWNGNVYTNDYLGLKFNMPTSWKHASDEEITENLNKGLELFDEDQKEAAEKALETNGVYYLQAIDPDTNDNVIIFTEKNSYDFSEDYYLEQVGKQLADVDSIDYTIGNTGKETVKNREYTTLVAIAKMNGITMEQKYYVYKIEGNFVGIIITSTSGETVINNVINCFE